MAENSLPPPELLRQLLRYEPETGKLFWRERPIEMFNSNRDWKWWNGRFAGKDAFTAVRNDGYLVGTIMGHFYRAHRVIWVIVTGSWPKDQIDHEDHDRANNRWGNLREVSNIENLRNKSLHRNNASGVVGVYWDRARRKWRAGIRVGGRGFCLGSFDKISDAAAARTAAETKYGFHENHGR